MRMLGEREEQRRSGWPRGSLSLPDLLSAHSQQGELSLAIGVSGTSA